MRIVEIAGGGVAGLALGLALRREGVPVTVHEAGVYPRHRLCGEFISGAGPEEFGRLGITDLMEGSEVLTDAVWYAGDRRLLCRPLPVPARGISRWRLDEAMASRLQETGGEVRCEQRVTPPVGVEGWVLAQGRPRDDAGQWIGMKAHYVGMPMEAGLEMHLGRGGYAGIARVENGIANVCALFPAGQGSHGGGSLPERLKALGLSTLAARLEAARPVEASVCGVSRFVTGWQPRPVGTVTLGDRFAIVPPFTGHGMSMAMQAALETAPLLAGWSRGSLSWEAVARGTDRALRCRFQHRLRWAAWLHPLLSRPGGQAALGFLARAGWLPWRWLFERVR